MSFAALLNEDESPERLRTAVLEAMPTQAECEEFVGTVADALAEIDAEFARRDMLAGEVIARGVAEGGGAAYTLLSVCRNANRPVAAPRYRRSVGPEEHRP